MDLQGEYAQLKAENARLETSMNDIVKELSDGVSAYVHIFHPRQAV